MIEYKELAEYLIKAEKDHHAVTCITDKRPDFDIPMGYQVQNELINLKKAQGHEIVAFKMGLTSQAKMQQMNINEPIYGVVFDYMVVPDKGEIVMDELIHPKVEAEVAFILNEDIEGPDITGEQVLAKTKWIFPALEIIDSRYENFKFKLPDVIADNTSSSRVVFGNQMFHPNDFEMDSIEVILSMNGKVKTNGTSSAVLGNPANSVAMLASMLYRNGKGKIPKDSVVLTGGITEAVLVNKGDYVTSKYVGMGNVSLHVR
ncbi:MAG: 2-keto-4-pentenoate hydratase [Bacillota bacterium]